MSNLTVETLRDREARHAAIDDLARLRITVFREWPYLYDGSVDYEQRYLSAFLDGADAALVIARNGSAIIGAATASPMSGQDEPLQAPFRAQGIEVDRLFYFGESVLLGAYRGHGLGHAFFDAREAVAREAGATATCFCGVIRPADHPLRPAEARDLGPFWHKRGYQPLEGIIAEYRWKDIDQTDETSHPMQFWSRNL
ncbi:MULTISPECIES: GNAT family N-acetyltransferase [unclassified Sphingobium]|uniref:GNAT family N-acetyltransferase n=1 Tax=unclassified Sphingobium TaxID=2611147 RepID=UPI002224A69C|nr:MULTISPECIES: GNAT family N-acetyltransferase [unclassified Sphingobium]MCW2394698.1 GNAT superfamily N-acetyltransferase [Sphingobium sp. B8D3B]MCW2418212.1 GNAT superfamily N-acetyltransferase [Sphingobium sp. B8D3C]